jgi:hypothetical protein
LKSFGSSPYFFGDAIEFIVEHIAQALGEDQRQDVILVLRRVLRATDGAGGVPQPLFERFVVVSMIRHQLLNKAMFAKANY